MQLDSRIQLESHIVGEPHSAGADAFSRRAAFSWSGHIQLEKHIQLKRMYSAGKDIFTWRAPPPGEGGKLVLVWGGCSLQFGLFWAPRLLGRIYHWR